MKPHHTLLLAFLFIGFSNSIRSQSVSTQSLFVAPTLPITVNFSGFPGNTNDWVAIAPVGFADDKSSYWYYTGGGSSGTVPFPGLPEGKYEVRGYFKNEYVVRCRYQFTVGYASAADKMKAETEKTKYAANEKINVNYSNFPGNGNDWIAIAPVGFKDDQSSYWFYTEGKKSGTMPFPGLPEGTYEVRSYMKNEYVVQSRYTFTVGAATGTGTSTTTTTTTTVTGTPSTLCRRELSTFYAGVGGLGSAWARAAHEPTIVPAGSIAAMQAVIKNAKTALEVVKCVPYDVAKIDALIAKLPSLTNAQCVAEIEFVIKDIQAAVEKVTLNCGNGSTLMSLYVLGIHIGAAQAHANSRMCQPAPMPAALQTVIFNHLQTAQTAFADFLGCVPGFPLSSITDVPLNSAISIEPEMVIVGLHTNILWNIALTDCCCSCK
ncbi:MAG: hypothetical protein IPI31_09105 [Bacteroidetes bacterium]|nr:hypothetical protein [Bacteroidota bacterium]MBK7567970.1 hypothetical protein [Bacteroidota bacterium]MBP9796773.1 hypothetical protein [Chitinophagales bacterium]